MKNLKMKKNTTYLSVSDYNKEDQVDIYMNTLNDVINDPKYYLDTLEYTPEYRVCFGTYNNRSKSSNITHLPISKL